MRNANVERIVKLGLWAALSVVMVLLVHFPIFPAVAFIEYDPGDIPILMASFAFGPWWGLLLTVVVSVIQGLTVSSASGVIGILMHVAATGAGVVVAGLVYQRRKTRRNATIGLILYILAILIIMPILNYFLTPIFLSSGYGMPYAVAQAQVWDLMVWILLFNLIKPIINAVVTFLLYKPVSRFVLKEAVVEEGLPKKRNYLWVDFATFGIYVGVVSIIHVCRMLFFPSFNIFGYAAREHAFSMDNAVMILVYLVLALLTLYLDGKWRKALRRRDAEREAADKVVYEEGYGDGYRDGVAKGSDAVECTAAEKPAPGDNKPE